MKNFIIFLLALASFRNLSAEVISVYIEVDYATYAEMNMDTTQVYTWAMENMAVVNTIYNQIDVEIVVTDIFINTTPNDWSASMNDKEPIIDAFALLRQDAPHGRVKLFFSMRPGLNSGPDMNTGMLCSNYHQRDWYIGEQVTVQNHGPFMLVPGLMPGSTEWNASFIARTIGKLIGLFDVFGDCDGSVMVFCHQQAELSLRIRDDHANTLRELMQSQNCIKDSMIINDATGFIFGDQIRLTGTISNAYIKANMILLGEESILINSVLVNRKNE